MNILRANLLDLEFTGIYVYNKAHNVIPAKAKAQFNIRYNNFHTTKSLKNKIFTPVGLEESNGSNNLLSIAFFKSSSFTNTTILPELYIPCKKQ